MGGYLVKRLSTEKDMEIFVTSRKEHTNFGNVQYIVGNARDGQFMKQLLENTHFDTIVDFMNYNYEEFEEWHTRLLDSTDHYIFLSSSRVYDYSPEPLVESSPRLLDTTTDKAFFATNRYAMRKAREENMLINSGKSNFTIIRPYITYSDRRLQLGICEKEDWLYRVLNDMPILFSENVLDKRTTLTFGEDVSWGIANIIKRNEPNGQSVHITTEETMTWGDILNLYKRIIKEETGKDVILYTSSEISSLEEIYEGGYNTIYDRQWNRLFCNSKAEKMCGHIEYRGMEEGLSHCLRNFICDWKIQGNAIFLPLNETYHNTMDSLLEDVSLKKRLFA